MSIWQCPTRLSRRPPPPPFRKKVSAEERASSTDSSSSGCRTLRIYDIVHWREREKGRERKCARERRKRKKPAKLFSGEWKDKEKWAQQLLRSSCTHTHTHTLGTHEHETCLAFPPPPTPSPIPTNASHTFSPLFYRLPLDPTALAASSALDPTMEPSPSLLAMSCMSERHMHSRDTEG